MKQTALFLSLLMIVFSSCKKEDIDGVYDPKKKIDRIYKENLNGEKYLVELWNWDKKQLKSIDQYDSDGKVYNTETYSYNDNGQIESVSGDKHDWTAYYHYKDDVLDYVETYFTDFVIQNEIGDVVDTLKNILAFRVDCFYDGECLSKVEFTEFSLFDNRGIITDASFNPLRFVLPERTLEAVKTVMKKTSERSSSKEDRVTVLEFEWEGENIKTQKSYTKGSETVEYTETYKYDDKINPYYNLYDSWSASIYKKFSNKNNLTYSSYKRENDSSSGETHHQYEYKGDYPIKRTTGGDVHPPIGVEAVFSGTYHYEYK